MKLPGRAVKPARAAAIVGRLGPRRCERHEDLCLGHGRLRSGFDTETVGNDLWDLDLGERPRPRELVHRLLDVSALQGDKALKLDDRGVGFGQALVEIDIGGFLEDVVDLVQVPEPDADLGQRLEGVGLEDRLLAGLANELLEHLLRGGESSLVLAHPGGGDCLALVGDVLPAEVDLGEGTEDRLGVQVPPLLEITAGDTHECCAGSFRLIGIHLPISLRRIDNVRWLVEWRCYKNLLSAG